MRRFLQTLYGKISAVFLALLLASGLVQIWFSIDSSMNFVRESDQALNRDLAKNLANKFRPFLTDSLDFPSIEHLIHNLMVMNPRVEYYVLDPDGKILAYFADHKKIKLAYVDLDPVHRFLEDEQTMPILGNDPRNPGGKKPFSATRIDIGKDIEGYLYVILGGEKFDSAAAMIKESYIQRTTLVNLAVTLMLTGVVGLFAFRFLTKRFRGMTRVVEDFEAGDFSRRLVATSNDEVGQLAGAFNSMADTIQANMEELRQTDQLRRELIANVSHDLRSPLASIQGYIETVLMKNTSLTEQQREKYLKTILDNTVLLSTLVSELFELSKYDAKQVQPKLEHFSIAELTQDVVMKFRPEAEQRQVKLLASFPKDLPMVVADIAMIERTLSNLIDNALRYTPEQGSVKVELARSENKIAVMVRDTGCGIPKNELAQVFDRFYRVDKSRGSASKGTGLGLAIASKIIELHEETIQVTSQRNKGTSFSFNLSALN